MTGLRPELALAQNPALSPLAVRVLGLLALTQAEVDAVVAGQAATNAVLQVGPPRRCRWCAGWLRGSRCPGCVGQGGFEEAGQGVDVREALRLEARLLVPSRVAPAVDVVVAHLDERGLLPEPVEALSTATGVPVGDLTEALAAVRLAGPPGTGAASPTDALLVQARWHVDRGAPRLLLPLVKSHLPSIARGELAAVAAALDAPVGEVDAAVSYLRRRLTPAPLGRGGRLRLEQAPPDAVVLRVGAELHVHVLRAEDLGLGLDSELCGLRVGGSAQEWLVGQVLEARDLLDAVDRRATALERVVRGAVEAQRAFVLEGAEAHVPLTRVALAARLGVHASTVSRAVKGTMVALPGGRRLPLSAFFGCSVAPSAVLARILASDTPPGSDAEAAARLAAAGIPVARRTVAKYRHQLA